MISSVMNILCTYIIFGLLKASFVAARWSTWGAWGHCSVTCGREGTMVSHRTCSQQGSCDGSSSRTMHCYPRPHHCPPVDGHLTTWGYWGSCSATCEGTRTRTRVCNPPQHGGAPCSGSTVETSGCGASHCPVNGGWSGWIHPTPCSVTCGGGVKTWTRTCNHPTPAYGGLQCLGESHMSEHCNGNPCPVDGGWSGWNHPSACSVTCGGGVRTRTRTCNHPTPAYGGHQCRGESHISGYCNENPCPVNGVLLAWGDWSPCSATCGSGSRVRSRACIPPKYGGLNCTGPLFEINNCIKVPCQINGGWSGWNHPSACSVTCGGGVRTRTRTCNHPTPAYGGHQCRGESHMTEHCNENPCPVNGGWSGWNHPSACSVTCGGGVRTRTRTCNHPTPAYGGYQCLGESYLSEHCNGNPCPVNGGWSGWNHPSACSVTCGGGVRTRTRTCNHPTPSYGGLQCQGESHMSEHCNENPCPAATCASRMDCNQQNTLATFLTFAMPCPVDHIDCVNNQCFCSIDKVTTTSRAASTTSPSLRVTTTAAPVVSTTYSLHTRLICPECDANLTCEWNQSCYPGEVCMLRQYHMDPFTMHCSKKQDCLFMKRNMKGTEILCCEDHQCITNITNYKK